MDEHAVMKARQAATKKGNKHWRRGAVRKKDSTSRGNRPKEWSQGMDQTTAPDFGALLPVNPAEDFPVDARKLHAALESKQHFTDWIGKRGRALGFEIGKDFSRIQSPMNEGGGRPAENFMLSIDMAKHLAMLERNEMGRRVRAYFIECEKRLLTQSVDVSEIQHIDTARALVSALEEKERLEQRNAILEPKAKALDTLSAAENLMSLQVAGNELGLGRTTFVKAMKARAILQHNGQPYRRHLDAGRFAVKPTTIWKGERQEAYPQVFVTVKGLTWLAQTLRDMLPQTHQQALPGMGDRPMLN